MSGIAIGRLTEERRNWRRDHPVDFYARQDKKDDGTLDLTKWEVGIAGPSDSDWENGVYIVKMTFPTDYPTKPPKCRFSPAIFHPNVFQSGDICLSILSEGQDWRPAITIKQIALGIQELLISPNPKSPANGQAEALFRSKPAEYRKKIREQALKFPPKED